MSVSVDTKGLTEKVFANFKKITPALAALALASGLVLFLPISILEKMALNDLKDIWKIVIGLVFIISLALIITIASVETIKCVQRKNAPKRVRRMKRKQFIALSDEYKEILVDMLRSPNCSKKLDPTSGNTLYLLNNQFIHQAQTYMFFGPGYTEPMTYTPQPWLIDLFNEEPDLFKRVV